MRFTPAAGNFNFRRRCCTRVNRPTCRIARFPRIEIAANDTLDVVPRQTAPGFANESLSLSHSRAFDKRGESCEHSPLSFFWKCLSKRDTASASVSASEINEPIFRGLSQWQYCEASRHPHASSPPRALKPPTGQEKDLSFSPISLSPSLGVFLDALW